MSQVYKVLRSRFKVNSRYGGHVVHDAALATVKVSI